MRIIEWKKKRKKKKKRTKWKIQEKTNQWKRKTETRWAGKWVFLVNPVVFWWPTNNIPSFPLSFHFFSFLVHLLLGNCHVHTTSLLQLYSPVATISHWTLFIYLLNFGLCSISVWLMVKQWKRKRKVKFISWFFCVFLFYFWFFPLVTVVIVK